MDVNPMRNRRSCTVERRAWAWAWTWAWAVALPGLAHAASPPNRIQEVKVVGTGDERSVRILTQAEPTFTVFRLNDPMRVVIDISGGDLGDLHGPFVYEDGVIGQVAVRQFNADGFLIGRIIVGFEHERGYDVVREGHTVVLRSTPLHGATVAASGPTDSKAAERFETARAAAQEAADAAKHERALADKATQEARLKQQEAEQVAQAATALAAQARKAQMEAVALRQEAEQSASANRARAEALAQEAEARQKKLSAEAQEVATARAETARLAKDAQAVRQAAEAKAAEAEAQRQTQTSNMAAELAQARQAQAQLTQEKAQAEAAAAQAGEALARATQTQHAAAQSPRTDIADADPTESTTADARAATDTGLAASASMAMGFLPPSPGPAPAWLTAIKAVGSAHGGVLLRVSGKPAFNVQHLDNPPRLVIDFKAARKRLKGHTIGLDSPWVKRVRLGEQDAGVLRAVFDLKDGAGGHDVSAVDDGILVRLNLPAKTVPAKTVSTAPQPPAVSAVAKISATASASVDVQDVRVRRMAGRSARIEIKARGAADATVDTSGTDAWILQIQGATVPEHLQRSLDASAYHTVLRQVATFQGSQAPDVVTVIANLDGAATSSLRHQGDTLIWEINAVDADHGNPGIASAAAPVTAGFVAQAHTLARSTPTQVSAGGKKHISLDVKDADIINVLRLISEETGENIIASDEVKGKVTLKLRNVPAEQALDTMLKTKGFDKVRQNNILRIALAESIQKERDLELAKRRSQTEVEETLIKMITINYATAAEIVDQIKPMLTARGSVQVDSRTNTIILQDIASNVDRLVELARRLDKQTPMVLIQARIVEATSSFIRDLGIQWGGQGVQSALTGNRTGLGFPGNIRTTGAADDLTRNQTGGLALPTNYAVNLPGVLNGQGGALGFILQSADNNTILNLRLSAMEQSGAGKIISSPEVATLDNKTAKVSQGVEIPISVVSAAGTNTRFIPAALELEVTPHVTNDGTVLLKIKAQKSAPDFTQKGAAGDPTIQKKFAETEVLVRDGDTSVIGGIYQRTTNDNVSEVPFLARLPLIGTLFREHRTQDDRSELLVFITPRIVNREESLVPGAALFDNAPKTGAKP